MNVFAKLISWAFIPLLAPIYALLIVMYSPSLTKEFYQENSLFILPQEAKQIILYLFGAFSFLAPALTILFLQTQGRLSSVMMEERKERFLPSVLVVIYAISLFILLMMKVPGTLPGARFLYGLSLGSLLAVTLATFLTFRWKVSLHSTGMGILSAFLFCYNTQMLLFNIVPLITVFILSGLVMSARMYLKLHTLPQLLIGYLIGFISTSIGVFYFLFFWK
jgi:membrane-associated phospholipid phosphatase